MNSISKQLSPGSLLILLCTLAACDSKPMNDKSPYEEAKESLKASDIQPGPIRHDHISEELDARIRKFGAVFAEVYPITHKEWIDGFQRDAVPENEVVIWEQMASAYSKFLESADIDAAARKEAFGLLLVRSSTADIEGRYSELKVLTTDQAKSLVALYDAAPKPVTYQSAEQDGGGQPATRPESK